MQPKKDALTGWGQSPIQSMIDSRPCEQRAGLFWRPGASPAAVIRLLAFRRWRPHRVPLTNTINGPLFTS
jgi:hypothetical protein